MTTVIFTSDAEDAVWAVGYYLKHRTAEKVIILAKDYTTQKILSQNRIPATAYYETGYFTDYFLKKREALVQREKEIIEVLFNLFRNLKVSQTELLNILTVVLEQDFLYILFAYEYFWSIKSKWKPKKYYIPQSAKLGYIGASSSINVIAALAREFFINKKQLYIYQSGQKPRLYFPDFSRVRQKLLHISKSIFFKYINILDVSMHQKNELKPKDILIFSAGYNLLDFQKVFSKKMRQQANFVTGPQSPYEEYLIRRQNIGFTPLQKWLNRDAKNEVVIIQDKLLKEIPRKLKMIRTKNIFSLPKPLHKAIIKSLETIIYRYLEKSIKQTLLAKSAIKELRPKLVITTHDPGPSAVPFVFEGRAQHSKTLVLAHGYCYSSYSMNHYSDAIIVYSKEIKNFYIQKMKKPKNSIYIGGFPAMDRIFIKKRADYLPGSIKIVGFLLTPFLYDSSLEYLFFRQIFEEAKRNIFPGQFWIRTHPGFEIANIEEMAKDFGVSIKHNPQMLLDKFVQACDLIVAQNTTAMFWPMAYSKLLIYTTPLWGCDFHLIRKYKAAWIPKDAKELFKIVANKATKKDEAIELQRRQRAFLKDYLGYIDGSAHEHAQEQIIRVLKAKFAY